MTAMPPAGRNPFGSVESAAVLAALRTAGSYDTDALYATKQRWLTPYRDLRRLAIVGILVGCALVFVLAMPIFGALAFICSAFVWRFQAKQVANVEAGYAQFLAAAKS